MSTHRVEIELPQDLMAVLNVPEADLSRRAREWVILELFQEGEISSGKAAEILGLSRSRFLELLNARKLPYLDAGPGELERDLAAAG